MKELGKEEERDLRDDRDRERIRPHGVLVLKLQP